jgi:UDP-N-acetylglucosamine transferase subunit ALG13
VIFVTVGAQMPFDRLITGVDQWAGQNPGVEWLAQIGASTYEPKHIANWKKFLEPDEFRRAMERADVIVGHAGTGTIIMALEIGKPILVMPRHARLGETRNDHQIATAKRFRELNGVSVADDEHQLQEQLDAIRSIPASATISSHASSELINAIRDFINGNEQGSGSNREFGRLDDSQMKSDESVVMEPARRVG